MQNYRSYVCHTVFILKLLSFIVRTYYNEICLPNNRGNKNMWYFRYFISFFISLEYRTLSREREVRSDYYIRTFYALTILWEMILTFPFSIFGTVPVLLDVVFYCITVLSSTVLSKTTNYVFQFVEGKLYHTVRYRYGTQDLQFGFCPFTVQKTRKYIKYEFK